MIKKCISIILIFIMINICTIRVIAASLSELENKKQDLEKQQQKVENKKDEITEQKNNILDEISSLNIEISKYENEINDLNGKIDKLKTSISEKEGQIKKLEEEVKKRQDLLIKRLVAMYEMGKTTYLDVLLASEDMTDFISNYYRIKEIAEADQEVIDSTIEKQKQVDTAKQELEKEKDEISEAKKEIEKKNESLQIAKESKEIKVSKLSSEEKELQAEIDKFESAIKEAQNEIEEATKNTSSSGGNDGYIGNFEGKFSWPISSNTPYYNYISSFFGPRPSPTLGASSNHGAVDIPISYAPVYAPASGKIIIARYLSGYGNYIMIDHGDGYYTGFGHLSAYSVSEGQNVSRGQKIATSGNTGITTGDHLHYEVYIGGTDNSYRVDPLKYTSHPNLEYN